MRIHTETFWNPTQTGRRFHWHPDILLNGELGVFRSQDDGCRMQYRFPRQGLLMKMETSDYQSERESTFWERLPSYLRSVFTPCLGVGTLEPWSTVIENWAGDMVHKVWDQAAFTLAPWYEGLRDSYVADPSIHDQVANIADTLGVGDFGEHQWKVTRFGTPLIHDYGYAHI